MRLAPRPLGSAALAALLLASCSDEPASSRLDAPPVSTGTADRSGTAALPERRGNTPRGADFADWVVSTDPRRQYILDAFVRDERILGVKVNPHMTRRQVHEALGSLATSMQRAFPGRTLQVIAYYESGDEMARAVVTETGRTEVIWKR